MLVYSLYILNKAGGLIYQTDLSKGLNKLTANDYLVLAGTLHGVHAIASRITPAGSHSVVSNTNPNMNILSSGKSQLNNLNTSGLKSIETDLFSMYVFQSLTGLKFILVTSPGALNNPSNTGANGSLIGGRNELLKNFDLIDHIFKQLYIIYSDYVMKNPFYSLDMPIRCELFDTKVVELIKS